MLLLSLMLSSTVWAEDSATLPRGVFRARLKPVYAAKIKSQFGETRHAVGLLNKFEKELDVSMAAKLNPQLAGAMNVFGIASLGKFDPSLELSTLVLGSAVEYGLTENLTVGTIIPLITANTAIDLKFMKSDAAKNHPAFRNQDFVKAAEQVAVSKGYHSFENWDRTGLGDVELGLKYRFLNSQTWAMAAKTGIRFPTGKTEDPNHLTDIGFGDGQYDTAAALLLDYKGIPNIVLSSLTKYTLQFPDHQILRVPDEGELFTSNMENIKRDLGDLFEAAFYAEYTFFKLLNVNASTQYFSKRKDNYKSTLDFNTGGLEKNTNQMKLAVDMGVGFTTIPWFKEGFFSFPMDIGFNVQLPITGQNIVKATTANLEYKLYF